MKRIAASLVVILLISVLFMGCLGSDSIQGFAVTDLRKPIAGADNGTETQFPTPLTTATTQFSGYTIKYAMTEAYETYGGVLLLQVENDLSSRIFVYGYGLRWTETGQEFYSNTSVYIDPGATEEVGLLAFGAPDHTGPHQYSIFIMVVAKSSYAWKDYGESISTTRSMSVISQTWGRNYTITSNDRIEFNMVNSRVDFDLVSGIVNKIVAQEPGGYSVHQIAEAYRWMEENVEYVEDEDGDHWQSVQETLDNYTGDCEDQAILMASIVTALGGTARVNLIHEHAFPSVFVGSTSIEAEAASQAIRSYYGSQGDELHVCYLVDDLGYWMVIDTTGSPYAGGLPALAAPFHSANPESWTFEDSNYLVTIDVTGEESEGGFLGF